MLLLKNPPVGGGSTSFTLNRKVMMAGDRMLRAEAIELDLEKTSGEHNAIMAHVTSLNKPALSQTYRLCTRLETGLNANIKAHVTPCR